MPQLECRVVITHKGSTFLLGMYDPISGRYVPLGEHPSQKKPQIVHDLCVRIQREGHLLTFCERHER